MAKSLLNILKWIANTYYPHPINTKEYIEIDMISSQLVSCLNWWQTRQYHKWLAKKEKQDILKRLKSIKINLND